MKLNDKIHQILLKIAKKDHRFFKYYIKVKNHKFREIDELLFRNDTINRVGILMPLDTIIKQMYYIKKNGHKIYIWIWIDEQDNIIEIEFYDIENRFEYEKVLDIFIKENIFFENTED